MSRVRTKDFIYATGTTLAGKHALDVNVSSIGSDSFTQTIADYTVTQATIDSDNPTEIAATPLTDRKLISITNKSSTFAVYFGPDNAITATSGDIILPLATKDIALPDNLDIFLIVDTNTFSTGVDTTVTNTARICFTEIK